MYCLEKTDTDLQQRCHTLSTSMCHGTFFGFAEIDIVRKDSRKTIMKMVHHDFETSKAFPD